MSQDELLDEMTEFLCNNDLWNKFLEEIKKKGYTINMKNRTLYTFTLADSEGLSEERVGYVAEEIAAEQAEKDNWDTDYSLVLKSVESGPKDKLYNYAVVTLNGSSDQEDE